MSNQTNGLAFELLDIFWCSRYLADNSKIDLAKFHENRLENDREISEKHALQGNVTLGINSVSTVMSDPRWRTASTDLSRENMIGTEVPDKPIQSKCALISETS